MQLARRSFKSKGAVSVVSAPASRCPVRCGRISGYLAAPSPCKAESRREKERCRREGLPDYATPLEYPQATDPVFPGNHVKLFNGILDRAKLKRDRDEKPRTAYSLRHTYICMRLMEGADIYQIAKNCRASVEMIEKCYAAHIKSTLDAASINVRRPEPAARKPQPANTAFEIEGDE